MPQLLKTAIIPYDIAWGDKEENLLSVEEWLCRVDKDTDIVILPEMFSTGFVTDRTMVMSMAETNNDRTINLVKEWAAKYNFAICGSFMATNSGLYFNRAFFAEPSKEISFYDKKHLFSIGGESDIYTAGNKQSDIIRYRGWNIALVVCYDIRFPAWCRNVNNKYDILISMANWPESRGYAWRQLLIARAIENQSYIIGANRSGSDDYGRYSIEDSMTIDFKGNTISEQVNNKIKYALLDHESLERFRLKFPVWKDADKFSFS